MTGQQLVLTGGCPDGAWSCSRCAAELAGGAIAHREDCRWIADIRAAGRERCAALIGQQEELRSSSWFADLLREQP